MFSWIQKAINDNNKMMMMKKEQMQQKTINRQSTIPSYWNDPEHVSKTATMIHALLVRESRKADRVKSSFHAAAIVHKKKRIISLGINKRKSHPFMRHYTEREGQIFLHAEVDAIIKAINQYGTDILSDCSLYVLRTTKTGNVAYSRPCESCQSHIDHFKIKEVYFTL